MEGIFANVTEPGPFSREQVRNYLGVSEPQLNSWIDRTKLFDPIGRGRVRSYRFADLVSLAAIKAIAKLTVDPVAAADAVRRHSVYGSALHNPAMEWKEAGEFTLSAGEYDAPLVGVDGQNKEAVVKIRVWTIIFNLLDNIEADASPGSEAAANLSRYRAAMTRLHEQRSGRTRSNERRGMDESL